MSVLRCVLSLAALLGASTARVHDADAGMLVIREVSAAPPVLEHGTISGNASVDCGVKIGWVDGSPTAGDLPLRGTVFAAVDNSDLPMTATAESRTHFLPRGSRPDLVTRIPIEVRVVSKGAKSATVALTYSAPDPIAMDVVLHPRRCPSGQNCDRHVGSFHAEAIPIETAHLKTEVLSGTAESDEPCVGRLIRLDVAPTAPAYDISFAADEASFRAGKVQHAVVLNGEPEWPAPTTRIGLSENNFPLPGGTFVATVSALFVDGSKAEPSRMIRIERGPH